MCQMPKNPSVDEVTEDSGAASRSDSTLELIVYLLGQPLALKQIPPGLSVRGYKWNTCSI